MTPLDALAVLQGAAASGALGRWADGRGVTLVTVFGSAVDPGRVGEPHDLDVAVLRAAQTSLLDVVNDLLAMLRYDGLDVLDLLRAGPVAREQALVYGELLYERPVGLAARLQMAATTQRMDTAWLRRLQLDALAR